MRHSCFLFHQWEKWKDKSAVEKIRPADQVLMARGIEQERRCKRCNKVQLRVVYGDSV